MGSVKYDKWIHVARPVPMLPEVTELFGRWVCATYVFIRYIRRVVHYVRDIGGNYIFILIRIRVSPRIGDNMYETPARSGAL